jgi:hypothetical protein
MNDVVVQFLNGLDMDEDSETAFAETSSSEQTTGIDFWESKKTMYTTFQSEIEKVNKEEIVLFNPFKNHGFENVDMRNPNCEIVHVVVFSHFQGDYELELIPIHSFEWKNEIPQANF